MRMRSATNMEHSYSLKNALTNLTTKQKIGIGLAITLVLVLSLALIALISSNIGQDNTTEEDEITSYINEDGYEVSVETYTDEEGGKTKIETYTDDEGRIITIETHTNTSGETTVTGTKEDEYGNITTIDPNLVTTYFPYLVVREHSDAEPTLHYYVGADENSKIIRATIEYCAVEEDKALVEQYIRSIPIDLSSYTIEYTISETDIYCGD